MYLIMLVWAMRWNRVIGKGTLCFAPYPFFQWYLQSEEILLNIGMKCWNSAFNAQDSRVIIVVVQVGAVKISVGAVQQALRKEERRDETQFTAKIGGKTSLGPSYFLLWKFHSPVMPYYAETGRSRPPPLIAWLYREL
jgi:hypothetical protein